MSSKFDRKQYPWLTEKTTRIKDIFLYLHSEILDFVEYVTPSEEEINVRKLVVERIRKVVN
jgi:DNA polymerase sigma